MKERWLPVFFGVAACSWMPHWSCHYYCLETGSSFVVGGWEFSQIASLAHMAIYSTLISLNLLAMVLQQFRPASAMLSGACHLTIGAVHLVRLVRPFRFEVFNLPWSRGASAREVVVVIGFGIVCLAVARSAWRRGA